MRIASVVLFCILVAAAPTRADEAPRWMMELVLRGKQVEGTPLSWSDSRVQMLARDGRLWEFAPHEASRFRRTAPEFASYKAGEMRSALSREFGSRFEVTGTGHYLVVHPRGERDFWGHRFEELYRSFVHYFGVRGFQLDAPRFPLVAVVLKNQAEFLRYAASEGSPPQSGVLGYYWPSSNRLALYDTTEGSKSTGPWQLNAETIVHEATHQTAFNTGIHSRFAMPPRWVAEGLAMMFEAKGVWDPQAYTRSNDRINFDRLKNFRHFETSRPKGLLATFVQSDHLFGSHPSAAYAEAWALTYFLVETEPHKYSAYLRRTASRPPFEEYPTAERLADFTSVFGEDLHMLEARYLRFIAALD